MSSFNQTTWLPTLIRSSKENEYETTSAALTPGEKALGIEDWKNATAMMEAVSTLYSQECPFIQLENTMFIDQFRCAVEEALSLIERGTDFVYESLCFLKVSALHDHAAKHMRQFGAFGTLLGAAWKSSPEIQCSCIEVCTNICYTNGFLLCSKHLFREGWPQFILSCLEEQCSNGGNMTTVLTSLILIHEMLSFNNTREILIKGGLPQFLLQVQKQDNIPTSYLERYSSILRRVAATLPGGKDRLGKKEKAKQRSKDKGETSQVDDTHASAGATAVTTDIRKPAANTTDGKKMLEVRDGNITWDNIPDFLKKYID